MSLLAASVVLATLLIASYGSRRVWLACLSMVLSAGLLACMFFVATTKSPAEGRAKLAALAENLPPVFNPETLNWVTASLDRLATLALRNETVMPNDAAPRTLEAATAPGWFGANSAPKAAANSPVTWFLDDPNAPVVAPLEDGFAIGGINTSGQELAQVHATLKLDGSGREIDLALKVEGHRADAPDIPAGARFSFGSDRPGNAKPPAGAILTFRYVTAGQQKAAILYLSAATIARFASR